jgi:hypothetical protein
MKAAQTKSAGIAENARTEAEATSAAASAAAVKDDMFISITILQRHGRCLFKIRCQAVLVTCVPLTNWHAGVEACEPVDDRVKRDPLRASREEEGDVIAHARGRRRLVRRHQAAMPAASTPWPTGMPG